MINFAAQLLTDATISAASTGIIIWLFREWISERLKGAIKNEYDQKLETHKAELKARSDVEIERLRSQLSIAAVEHQIRFSGLHEKRAEVIATTYSLLQEVYGSLGSYVDMIQLEGGLTREQRRKAAAEAHKLFSDYYIKHRIFLPTATAEKLNSINRRSMDTYTEFYLTVDVPIAGGESKTEERFEIYKRVKVEIRAACVELEDEFRRLLGDE
jgi:hypothetical protein